MTQSLEDALDALRTMIEQFAIPDLAHSATDRERRWLEIDKHLGGQIAGLRVLIVGSDAESEAEAFSARGASQVLACATPPAPAHSGTFEIVHCDGLLHRVTEPVAMLRGLRSLTVLGGTLLIGSMIIDDPERSEYLRFIPDRYAGDPTWWFLPGRLAFRWLVEAAGFEVQAEFGEREGPRDLFPVISGYLKAVAVE